MPINNPSGFPNQVRSYTAAVDLVTTVAADNVNSLQQEVVAIETALGNATSTNPLTSTYAGTFSTATTSWNTVADRLLNIEAGLVNGVTNAPYVLKSGGSTITTTNNKGLTLTLSTGTNNLFETYTTGPTLGFNIDYTGTPKVGSNNVLYVNSTDYNSLVASINAASGTGGAAVAKSTFTTAGDIIYATAASTIARLGIGTTGQYLTVAAGIPAWTTLPSYISATLMTTAGDLIYYNAGNQRLPIGTSGQILTVSAGGLPSWTTLSTPYVNQTNGTVTTASTSSGVVRNIYVNTVAPSTTAGYLDGDIWVVYA